jgi:multiple sugar transport system permease protein
MTGSRERWGVGLMLAPYLVGLAVLIVVPGMITVSLALFEYDLIRPATFIGLDNFRELTRDAIFWTSLRNSLQYIAFAVPLRLLGALGLALLLHRRFRAVGAYRTAAYLPTVVPDVAYALVWLWIFNPLYGPVNLLLAAAGAPTPPWLTGAGATQAAVVIMSLFQIGEGFLVALATRQSIPDELYELIAIEGARPLDGLRQITLPMMAPTLLLMLFRDTIFSFQASFVPALVMTGGGPPPYATTYLPLFVYTTGFEYLRYGYAAAAAVVMLAVTAVIVLVQYRIVKRWRASLLVWR